MLISPPPLFVRHQNAHPSQCLRRAAIAALIGCFHFGDEALAADFYLSVGSQTHCSDTIACYATVECPVGTFPFGGGGLGDQSKMESSYPMQDGWAITFRGAYYEYASTARADMTAYAICSEAPSGYQVVSDAQYLCDHDGPSCSLTLSCPEGKSAIGGGMFGTESFVEQSTIFNTDAWMVSWYPDDEDFGSGAIGGAIPYAICVDALPSGFQLVGAAGINCTTDGPSCVSSIACPPDKVLIGGGFAGYQSKLESVYPFDMSNWVITWYPAASEYGSSANGIGVPIGECADGSYGSPDELFRNGFEA